MSQSAESSVDRHQPTLRPGGRNSGTQQWRDLLFLHWPVDADVLADCIPHQLTVDTFDGQAYVGLVPFKMRQIRPPWLPRQLAFNFYETNLRTYVLHNNRPGVYFFSLDASSRLAVMAARIGWSLPYYHAKMSGESSERKQAEPENAKRHTYVSQRRDQLCGSVDVQFRVGAACEPSELGTLQHFLFERYLLFVKKRGVIYSGHVHHKPYEVREAEIAQLQQTLTDAAGINLDSEQPSLAHFSPGVDVEVFAIRPDTKRDRQQT